MVVRKGKLSEMRGEMLGLWDISNLYVGTCDLVVFKVILGLFSAPVSKLPVCRKQLLIE